MVDFLKIHTRQTTFRQLEIFMFVAQHSSVTKAATELHLAQSTVSTQIKKLSDSLGVVLFEQVGKKLFLTEAGSEVLYSIREIFTV